MLSEPGTSDVVLERLAAHSAKGLPLNNDELAAVLNEQVTEHAPLGHANEVAWALWGMLIFGIQTSKPAAKVLSSVDDSVVALLSLHAKDRGLMHPALNVALWQSYLTTEQLYGEQWLLAYEASFKGWLSSPGGIDHIGADARFKWLRDLGVEFYDVDKAAVIAFAGGADEPEWLLDIEEENQARRSFYDDAEDPPPVAPDQAAEV